MTNNTGKVKKHKKKFQHLTRGGARAHRKHLIETSYINGIYNDNGEKVIRALTVDEKDFLNSYYKEFVHGTFVTDEESTRLFKHARKLTKTSENVRFLEENGFYPEEVEAAIEAFNAKSKALGNIAYKFWDQRDINSDDYKRRFDIQNNASKDLSLESFEDFLYRSIEEDKNDTIIEDLITKSEET
jgi:hypothetical protein